MSALPYYDFKSYDIDLNELLSALSSNSNSRYFDDLQGGIVTQKRLRSQMAAKFGIGEEVLLQEIESGRLGENERIITPADEPLFIEYFAKQYLLLLRDENAFLNYHFQKHFNLEVGRFREFAEKVIRSQSDLFPAGSPKLEQLKNFPPPGNVVEISRNDKNFPGRQVNISYTCIGRRNDTLTSLTQKDTAALFYYLREQKIILDKELVSDTLLADLIQIMTGYKGTMRTDISEKVPNREASVTLKNKLKEIITLIDRDIAKKKTSS